MFTAPTAKNNEEEEGRQVKDTKERRKCKQFFLGEIKDRQKTSKRKTSLKYKDN